MQQIESQRWVRGPWSSTKFSELQICHFSLLEIWSRGGLGHAPGGKAEKMNYYLWTAELRSK
jgi:hypothetical protein